MNGYDTIKYNTVSKKSGERRDLMGKAGEMSKLLLESEAGVEIAV
jgi:hypothetical protein